MTNATAAFVSLGATKCRVRAVWSWDEPRAFFFNRRIGRPAGESKDAAITRELAAKGAAIHLRGNGAQTKALRFKTGQRYALFGL